MAQLVSIPVENTIYDWIRIALNEDRNSDAFMMYDMLTNEERNFFQKSYPEIYSILHKVYMREKVTTATRANNI